MFQGHVFAMKSKPKQNLSILSSGFFWHLIVYNIINIGHIKVPDVAGTQVAHWLELGLQCRRMGVQCRPSQDSWVSLQFILANCNCRFKLFFLLDLSKQRWNGHVGLSNGTVASYTIPVINPWSLSLQSVQYKSMASKIHKSELYMGQLVCCCDTGQINLLATVTETLWRR